MVELVGDERGEGVDGAHSHESRSHRSAFFLALYCGDMAQIPVLYYILLMRVRTHGSFPCLGW